MQRNVAKFDRIVYNSIYKSDFSGENSDRFLEGRGLRRISMIK